MNGVDATMNDAEPSVRRLERATRNCVVARGRSAMLRSHRGAAWSVALLASDELASAKRRVRSARGRLGSARCRRALDVVELEAQRDRAAQPCRDLGARFDPSDARDLYLRAGEARIARMMRPSDALRQGF
jgi:hypothetical protein